MKETKLKEAKRVLYKILLEFNNDQLTDNEVDIIFLLSKDRQIQQIFDLALEKESTK